MLSFMPSLTSHDKIYDGEIYDFVGTETCEETTAVENRTSHPVFRIPVGAAAIAVICPPEWVQGGGM